MSSKFYYEVKTTLEVAGSEYEVAVNDSNIYIMRHEDELDVEFDANGTETVEDIKALIEGWEFKMTEDAWESFLSGYYSR